MPSFPTQRPALDEIDTAASWRRLGGASLGHLGMRTERGVDIVPVNFLVFEDAIIFRSAPGAKFLHLTNDPAVAFQVDGVTLRSRWSVVATGEAHRMNEEPDIRRTGILDLHTQSPTEKWNYVRITVEHISGREFARFRGRFGAALLRRR